MSERNFASKIQNIGAWMEINRVPIIPNPHLDQVREVVEVQAQDEDISFEEAALRASINSANDGDPIDAKNFLKLTELPTGQKAQIAKVAHINEAKARRFLNDSPSRVFAALDEARPFQQLQGSEHIDTLDIDVGVQLQIGVPSYLKENVTDSQFDAYQTSDFADTIHNNALEPQPTSD